GKQQGSIEGLERFDSPGKGRGLRVTRPFKLGELLFSSPAYSYVLSVKERGCLCEFCFTRKEGLARCGKCKKAFYCNVKCQKGDWAMHKLECSAMTAFGEKWCPSEMARLVARILAKKKVQKERCVSEKILLLGEMQSHVEDVDNEKREMNEADIAGLYQFYSKHLDMPDHKDLLTLFSQVACNGFTIEDDELSHMGTAVYPDVALINHSCLPSVIVTYNGTSAEVRAVQDMKPGDEVLISYIDLLYPTDDRNNRLRESYYFTCDCQECKSKSKVRTRQKFRASKNLLEMCEQSLEGDGNIDGAIRYGEKILKPYNRLYPPYSLNVSSMYLKLGRLYMGMERHSMGISAFKKALAIMEVAHGKDHSYLVELRKEMAQK
uniref:[histone H3]-lysine(4) N-trimethyltransferase n=1 Tax=Lates calcarifer TaxID=8187 RepID=A0A4W6D4K0_LATCA